MIVERVVGSLEDLHPRWIAEKAVGLVLESCYHHFDWFLGSTNIQQIFHEKSLCLRKPRCDKGRGQKIDIFLDLVFFAFLVTIFRTKKIQTC